MRGKLDLAEEAKNLQIQVMQLFDKSSLSVEYSIYVVFDLQGEPHQITLQIDLLKHFRVSAFEILKRKV